jgi:hypothetical protein
MADAATVHAWMVAHERRRAAGPALARHTSLTFDWPVHTAWPEPSPDAPRRGINHLSPPDLPTPSGLFYTSGLTLQKGK